MNTKMPVGVSDFKEAREGYYLVDKTQFICNLIDEHKKVTLFTRPRRFGKTLTMSMLEYFFSIDKKEEAKNLFTGLAIDKAGTTYIRHQGRYPVIFTTLKDFYNPNWDSMYRSIKLLTQDIYTPFAYLLDSSKLLPSEKEFIQQMIDGKAAPEAYQVSLKRLAMFLYKHYGIQPIILIDEYDAPLQNAYNQGFYEEAVLFWKGWFNAALKDNGVLRFAILTGVLRVAKKSIFSGLNNLAVYSVLEHTYSDVFGFTAKEVRQMATDLQAEAHLPELKQWYDGYTFGQTEMYNPWSVIQYFSEHCTPAPYWISTSDNSILRQLLHHATALQIKALQDLLQGKSIATSINPNIIYRTLQIESRALYTILLTTGYLTADTAVKQADNRYCLRIPNEEIKRVYRLEILDTLVQNMDSDTFEDLFDSLFTGQTEQFEMQLQALLVQFVSTYDTAHQENFYHGFMLGMTALFLTKDYDTESNRESGYGRFDLAIFPRNLTKSGVIMEFKVAKSEDELDDKAKEALQQIERKAYITEFQKRNIQHVWKYGIAFYGKHVKIIQSI